MKSFSMLFIDCMVKNELKFIITFIDVIWTFHTARNVSLTVYLEFSNRPKKFFIPKLFELDQKFDNLPYNHYFKHLFLTNHKVLLLIRQVNYHC